MLLWLSEWLAKDVRAFNVFAYISLRAVLATMTALVISVLVGPRMIAWLARMRIGQAVRDDGPQTHLIKAGTPTMGGALILVSIAVTTLLWADLDNRFIWVVLLVTAIDTRISAPPIVGVPALIRCVCGPSSRTAWPMRMRASHAIIRGPTRNEMTSAVIVASTARSEM